MNPKTFRVSTLESLHLRIFTIGYCKEGESILGILCDGEKNLYSFVVDSYSYTDSNYNHVSQLLQKENIQQIDAFIWTHPDEDHSKGICELLEQYDKEHSASIFIPATLNAYMPICEDARKGLEHIMNCYNNNRIYNLKAVGLTEHDYPRCLIHLDFYERRSNVKISCKFNFFLPYNTFLQRRLGQKSFDPNDFSIFFSLECNGFNYIFTGDLVDQCLKFINFNSLLNVRFIKIPHHGSSEIKKFAFLISSTCCEKTTSTVTEKTNSGLPQKDVLDEYKKFCKNIFQTSASNNNCGCIETIFNISNPTPIVKSTGNVIKH